MNWNGLEIPDNPYFKDDDVVIYHGDCREILPELPKVDLVLTSPPYDDLRAYGGFKFNIEGLPQLIYRVMVDKACCVWVVGDQVIDGSESLSSFKQAIKFVEAGFSLHDTIIYQKNNSSLPDPTRYYQVFEYMFVFSKGVPKTFNPIEDKLRKWWGRSAFTKKRDREGRLSRTPRDPAVQSNKRSNIWVYDVGFAKSATDKIAFKHPATFPEKLAIDHILSWSNINDLVLDPLLGSGTTAYCAKKLNRHCIGIEIEEKYCEISAKRCSQSVMRLE